eukprot:3060024-Amphidinium_carterae.1
MLRTLFVFGLLAGSALRDLGFSKCLWLLSAQMRNVFSYPAVLLGGHAAGFQRAKQKNKYPRVIGAGFALTGEKTLGAALETMGYKVIPKQHSLSESAWPEDETRVARVSRKNAWLRPTVRNDHVTITSGVASIRVGEIEPQQHEMHLV